MRRYYKTLHVCHLSARFQREAEVVEVSSQILQHSNYVILLLSFDWEVRRGGYGRLAILEPSICMYMRQRIHIFVVIVPIFRNVHELRPVLNY